MGKDKSPWMQDYILRYNQLNVKEVDDSTLSVPSWIKVCRFLQSTPETRKCLVHDSTHSIEAVILQNAIMEFEEKRNLSVKNLLGAYILCEEYEFICPEDNSFELVLQITKFDSPAGGSCSPESIDDIPNISSCSVIRSYIQNVLIKRAYAKFTSEHHTYLHNELHPSESDLLTLSAIPGWLPVHKEETQDLDDSWGATPMEPVKALSTSKICIEMPRSPPAKKSVFQVHFLSNHKHLSMVNKKNRVNTCDKAIFIAASPDSRSTEVPKGHDDAACGYSFATQHSDSKCLVKAASSDVKRVSLKRGVKRAYEASSKMGDCSATVSKKVSNEGPDPNSSTIGDCSATVNKKVSNEGPDPNASTVSDRSATVSKNVSNEGPDPNASTIGDCSATVSKKVSKKVSNKGPNLNSSKMGDCSATVSKKVSNEGPDPNASTVSDCSATVSKKVSNEGPDPNASTVSDRSATVSKNVSNEGPDPNASTIGDCSATVSKKVSKKVSNKGPNLNSSKMGDCSATVSKKVSNEGPDPNASTVSDCSATVSKKVSNEGPDPNASTIGDCSATVSKKVSKIVSNKRPDLNSSKMGDCSATVSKKVSNKGPNLSSSTIGGCSATVSKKVSKKVSNEGPDPSSSKMGDCSATVSKKVSKKVSNKGPDLNSSKMGDCSATVSTKVSNGGPDRKSSNPIKRPVSSRHKINDVNFKGEQSAVTSHSSRASPASKQTKQSDSNSGVLDLDTGRKIRTRQFRKVDLSHRTTETRKRNREIKSEVCEHGVLNMCFVCYFLKTIPSTLLDDIVKVGLRCDCFKQKKT